MAKRKLSDIIAGDKDRAALEAAWRSTEAAEELAPLPRGEYVALIVGGELDVARTGTARYKLTFRVAEGPYAGRRFWHDVYITEKALALAKRDLGKLGVTEFAQLEHPLPPGIRCRAYVVLHTDDNGKEHNKVRSFDVISIDPPQANPFPPPAPAASVAEGGEGHGLTEGEIFEPATAAENPVPTTSPSSADEQESPPLKRQPVAAEPSANGVTGHGVERF